MWLCLPIFMGTWCCQKLFLSLPLASLSFLLTVSQSVCSLLSIFQSIFYAILRSVANFVIKQNFYFNFIPLHCFFFPGGDWVKKKFSCWLKVACSHILKAVVIIHLLQRQHWNFKFFFLGNFFAKLFCSLELFALGSFVSA